MAIPTAQPLATAVPTGYVLVPVAMSAPTVVTLGASGLPWQSLPTEARPPDIHPSQALVRLTARKSAIL